MKDTKKILKRPVIVSVNSAAIVSLEDLQVVTDVLAKLDTQIKSLNKAFDKVDTRINANSLDVKNNIESVRNYVHWVGLTLISNIPNEESPLTLSAEDNTTFTKSIKITIESEEK